MNKQYRLCMFLFDRPKSTMEIITFGEPVTLKANDWKASAHAIQELIVTNDSPAEVPSMGLLPVDVLEDMKRMGIEITEDPVMLELGA